MGVDILARAMASGKGSGTSTLAVKVDHDTDEISLTKSGEPIADSGATLPKYGLSYDTATGGLTLTKDGQGIHGETVDLPPYGSPLKADTIAQMTDTDKVYVLTTDGHWYYYNGSAWTDGGVYNAVSVVTDKTLTVADTPADAKATGDGLYELKTQLNELENGFINFEKGKKFSDQYGTIDDVEGFATSDYIPLTNGMAYRVQTGRNAEYIILYKSDKTVVDYWTAAPNRDFRATSTQAYMRFSFNEDYAATVTELEGDENVIYIATETKGINEDISNINTQLTELEGQTETLTSQVANKVDKKSGAYSANDISLQYDIGNGYYTKGWLKLPTNYSLSGDPIPMIVFCHGSGDFGYIDAPMTLAYNDYYNYLRDCGYAVFDCYGFGNKYTYDHTEPNTWGIPLCNSCYINGIKYVCENYNIDGDNVFVTCKSLGGIQALALYYNNEVKIKAVGMLAPQLTVIGVKLGYNPTEKHIIADELGFTEDANHVLDFYNATDPIPEGFWDYLTENIDNWCGYFPEFIGLPIKNTDKPDYYQNLVPTGNMFRASLGRPLKIWIAPDDTAVSYTYAQAILQSISNSGYHAVLRTMPTGTGGHHSVDNDANAPQKTDVTTPLGVHYNTIPLAYYELEQFFRAQY